MNFSIKRTALLEALQKVGPAIAFRGTNPIYSSVKVSAAEDRLAIQATDLEVGITYEVSGVAVESPGQVMLPPGRLTSILRECTEDEVRIEADGTSAQVTTFAAQYDMPTEDTTLFADVGKVHGASYLGVAGADLARAIKRTAFAAAKDEGKFAMRGVLLDVQGDKLNLVATDGKRLAMSTIPATGDSPKTDKTSTLLPPKAMQLIANSIDPEATDPVKIWLHSNDAVVQTEKASIYTRLVEGRFPPYRDVIPKKFTFTIPIVAGSFLSLIRQAAIMTDDESKRITFTFDHAKLSLKAQGATSGKSLVTFNLGASAIHGKLEVHFDPQYLMEMLKAVDADTAITLKMVDGNKAGVFYAGEDYLYLCVPLV